MAVWSAICAAAGLFFENETIILENLVLYWANGAKNCWGIGALFPVIFLINSGVKIVRDTLFHIRKSDVSSLQAQIRETLVSAILDRQLGHEEPLPSTRKMAKILGVSRNTVVLAYQSLIDDGYLVSRERSGYYVNGQIAEMARPGAVERKAPASEDSGHTGPDWRARFRVQPAEQENISKPLDWQSYSYPFIYGQVDHNLFPITEWRECSRQALGKRWFGAWTNDTWENDDPLLVEQIRRRIEDRRKRRGGGSGR